MPHVITQSCCADASCVLACPVNCIHPAPGEPGFATTEMLFVDPKACVDCGACATACPVDAVVPHTTLSTDQQPFRALNATYYDTSPHADRPPLALVPRQRRLRSRRPVRFAVVGAGPAGMYVADELLKHPEAQVDVYDRLPTPYGLVRAGVAPDHQHTKSVHKLFAAVEQQPGFRYRLGVHVGRDLSLAELRSAYDGVVYAVGAATDRNLGIPGEHLTGCLSATALVGWYNGHPDQRGLPVDLGCDRVVVVGNGNVALDTARVLTADPATLARTDIADHALRALETSQVREVVVVGRRGPAQSAFTLPELIGLAGLDGVDVAVEGVAEWPSGDPRTDILRDLAARPPRKDAARRIVLRFFTSPTAVLGTDRVTGVAFVRNELVAGEGGRPVAVPTDEHSVIDAGVVLRSVGYFGTPVDDLPYDESTGTVTNVGGRVCPGVYVAGWVKRGPTGFIGSNKADAQETVAALLNDLDADAHARPTASPADLDALLLQRSVTVIDNAGWQAIDAEERKRGAALGRPRVKFTDPSQMLRAARR